jgi:hypothetical protein
MMSQFSNATFPAFRVALAAGLMLATLLGPALAGAHENTYGDPSPAYQRRDYATAARNGSFRNISVRSISSRIHPS